MRTVVVNNSAEGYTSDTSGAIATHIFQVRRAASRAGVHLELLTQQRPGQGLDDLPRVVLVLREPGRALCQRVADRVARLRGWRSARALRHYREVRRALRAMPVPPDHVVLHNDPDVAERLARRERWQVTHVFHNPLRYEIGTTSSVQHLAVSEWLAATLAAASGVHIGVLRNGVDARAFRPHAESPAPTRLPTVSFLGRTGREKGLDLLLDALLLVRERGQDFAALIIGSNTWGPVVVDDYQRHLQAQVESLLAAGVQVTQTGHADRSQVPALLASSAVHVVPSRWEEPACLALTEAMACGLAVVAARSGGMPEYGAGACRWFDKEDVDGLAHELDLLLADPAMRASLGQAARSRALELSWDATWQTLAAALASRGMR